MDMKPGPSSLFFSCAWGKKEVKTEREGKKKRRYFSHAPLQEAPEGDDGRSNVREIKKKEEKKRDPAGKMWSSNAAGYCLGRARRKCRSIMSWKMQARHPRREQNVRKKSKKIRVPHVGSGALSCPSKKKPGKELDATNGGYNPRPESLLSRASLHSRAVVAVKPCPKFYGRKYKKKSGFECSIEQLAL